MNKIAVSNTFNGYTNSVEGREEQLRKISNAKIGYIHWQYDGTGYYIYSQYEMKMIKEWLDTYGLKAYSVHASEGGKNSSFPFKDREERFKVRNYWDNLKDFTSENEYVRKAGVDLIRNRIDLAHAIGTDSIVLHLLVPYGEIEMKKGYKDVFYNQVIKSFKELEPYCREKGVKIALENLFTEPYQYEIEKFELMFNEFDNDFMGFCFDSGHGILLNPDNEMDFLERYKERLLVLHLHENDGRDDSHTIPFQVNNNFNWQRFAEIMAEINYDDPLLFETNMNRAGTTSCETRFFEVIHNAGNKLWEMIEKEKKMLMIK